MKREPIGKKLRFEVFKRDKFTCQYCGEKAPDVILHVDHINPVSKGGDNEILNLITSCASCNMGKGARELSDDSVVQKQRAQLEELEERRAQLEALLAWRDGLKALDEEIVQAAVDEFEDLAEPYEIAEGGREKLANLIKQFGLETVLDAIQTAFGRYAVKSQGGELDAESLSRAFNKISGIAYHKANPDKDSDQNLYYIRGILRNRLSYVNEGMCIKLLRDLRKAGGCLEQAKEYAKEVRNWSDWRVMIEEEIAEGGVQ